jgi:hypothetical protein
MKYFNMTAKPAYAGDINVGPIITELVLRRKTAKTTPHHRRTGKRWGKREVVPQTPCHEDV